MLLFEVYANPERTQGLSAIQWQQLLEQAYRAGAVARLHAWLAHHSVQHYIPSSLLWHFTSAVKKAQAGQRELRYALITLQKHLSAVQHPVCLLKGAAYAIDEQSLVGLGRRLTDVDLLVSEEALPTTEQVLHWMGWHFEKNADYDIQYYRRWMHELPPMYHDALPMPLDLHHHLVPPISRMAFPAMLLSEHMIASGMDGFATLTPAAQLIHTSLHMLTNDDFSSLLKDALDVFLLLQTREQQQTIAEALSLAIRAGVASHVHRALRVVSALFEIQMPAEVQQQVSGSGWRERWVDKAYIAVIRHQLTQPLNQTCVQQRLLWVRAHMLKMPMPILLQHTAHKLHSLAFSKSQKEQGHA